MREVVCINVGQAGIQMANAAWELFCVEHGIQCDGKLRGGESMNAKVQAGFQTFFEEVPSGNYVPRAILIDLEPTVIDEIRTSHYRSLWHPDYLLNSQEDAANNFARGHFTIGKNVIDQFRDQVRRCVNKCSSIQGFILLNSCGGGTGSGLSTLILELLDVEFSKNPKFLQTIFPAPQLATAITEPFNACLTTSETIDHTDLVTMIDNEAAYEICSYALNIPRPVYSNLNRIIAQLFSAMTVSLRFGSSLDYDLPQLQTNLVPYPRIHFPCVNYSPIVDATRVKHENFSIIDLTRNLFCPDNQFVKCDFTRGKYMSCCIQYRGLITPRQVNLAVYEMKRRTDITFVDWCPTGFKIGICPMPPAVVPGSELAQTERNSTMFCNNTAIAQLFQRLIQKFDLLFNKRAFVHWYVGEGMEESEFHDSRELIGALISDYIELGKSTEEEEEEEKTEGTGQTESKSAGNHPKSINSKVVNQKRQPSTISESKVSERKSVELITRESKKSTESNRLQSFNSRKSDTNQHSLENKKSKESMKNELFAKSFEEGAEEEEEEEESFFQRFSDEDNKAHFPSPDNNLSNVRFRYI